MKQLIEIMYMNITYIYSVRQHYRISEDISNITYTQLSDCIKKFDSCLISIIFIMKIKYMDITVFRIEKMLTKLKL